MKKGIGRFKLWLVSIYNFQISIIIYCFSFLLSLRFRKKFDSVRFFCIFVGYTKSGHSLIASILDAHPNIVISQELDVLKYIKLNFPVKQVYSLICNRSKIFQKHGATHKGYNYRIQNTFQGKGLNIEVIGDKYAQTLIKIIEDKKVYEKLLDINNLVFIHVIRNPFDVIATKYINKPSKGINHCINNFFKCAEYISILKKDSRFTVIDVYFEDIFDNFHYTFSDLLSNFSLSFSVEIERSCKHKIFKQPNKSRSKFNYTEEQIRIIQDKSSQYEFLKKYSFKS